jgi:thioredoxin reductase (NADPH)
MVLNLISDSKKGLNKRSFFMIKTAIIGEGPAGITASIYLARAGFEPLIISSVMEMGQLEQTTDVENFPGFPEGVLGPQLIQNMKRQAERFGAKSQQAHVEEISGDGPFTLKLDTGDTVEAETLLIATGAKPRRLGIPSETEYWGRGVSACATCDGFFFKGKRIVVIGGGDSACEEALFLTRFGSSVQLIHRRDELRASKIMAEKVLSHPTVQVRWNSLIEEIVGTKEAGVTGIVLKDRLSGELNTVETEGIFLAIGHIPNTELVKDFVKLDEEGFVVVDNHCRTSKEGVFAAGDVHDRHYRQAITSAGYGCQAALEIERYLLNKNL